MSFDCRKAQNLKRRCIPLNKFIFRRKPSEKKEQSLLRLLLPSVLGFALCFVCLAATTWAWFVVSVTSEANTIQSASFDVEVCLDGSTTPVAADANGSYTIAAGTHTIELKPTGNATKGFVVVEVAQQTSGVVLMMAGTGVSPSSATPDTTAAGTYCTPQLFDENGVPQVATFTLKTEGTVTLTPCWGEQKDYSNLSDKSVISATISASDEAQLTNEEEDPVDENQQEDEQENQQQEEEKKDDPSSNEQETPDDPENNGEGENTSTDTSTDGDGNEEQQPDGSSNPANGENGQQGDEQQPSEPSTPTDGEQGGEQPDVSGETTGGDISDDTTTGGESPTDTTTPTGGDVPTEPVVTTDPTVQSEGGAPTDPAPIE